MFFVVFSIRLIVKASFTLFSLTRRFPTAKLQKGTQINPRHQARLHPHPSFTNQRAGEVRRVVYAVLLCKEFVQEGIEGGIFADDDFDNLASRIDYHLRGETLDIILDT